MKDKNKVAKPHLNKENIGDKSAIANSAREEIGSDKIASDQISSEESSHEKNVGAAKSPHKRRPRYKGTHPKKFEEKYKEHEPEKYAEDIEKIKARGTTPAGSHRPICVDEISKILDPKPGEIALDATLGYGGHAAVLLEKILPGGRLIGVDQDPLERVKTEKRLRALRVTKTTVAQANASETEPIPESALLIAPINFSQARAFLHKNGIKKVDVILADLGISSMQLDDPQRGFSYKIDAPLDLRMNPHEGIPASKLLKKLTVDELAEILFKNSDEMRAQVIAKALIKKRPQTTLEFTKTIEEVISGFSKRVQREEGDAPVRRAFQALRIEINGELEALEQFLKDIPHLLNPGGRVAILSFHSGEDRRVKKSFQALHRNKIYRQISEEFIRPNFEEQRSNPRSKSAKLRWAIKS
jgi:16S rRNA (cytosine1402-N4)-methyltransferase